jgi:hypothetical protein
MSTVYCYIYSFLSIISYFPFKMEKYCFCFNFHLEISILLFSFVELRIYYEILVTMVLVVMMQGHELAELGELFDVHL